MNRQIIAVDADDTLFDENNAVRLFHNAEYGTTHSEQDYQKPGEFNAFWEHLWDTDETETTRRYNEFIEFKNTHNLPPLPGALEVLKQLKDKYQLVIVTARDERSVQMTHDALTEHYPDVFSDVHFVALWGGSEKATKAKICKEIGADFMIDDSVHTCNMAAEAGVTSLLFGEYGWNMHHDVSPGVVRVKDWQAVLEYFDEQG